MASDSRKIAAKQKKEEERKTIFRDTLSADPEVKSFDMDGGTWVLCGPCDAAKDNRKKVSLQRPFQLERWQSHKNSKYHVTHHANTTPTGKSRQSSIYGLFRKLEPGESPIQLQSIAKKMKLATPEEEKYCGGVFDRSNRTYMAYLDCLKLYGVFTPHRAELVKWGVVGGRDVILSKQCGGNVVKDTEQRRCTSCALFRWGPEGINGKRTKRMNGQYLSLLDSVKKRYDTHLLLDSTLRNREFLDGADVQHLIKMEATPVYYLSEAGQVKRERCIALLNYHRKVNKVLKSSKSMSARKLQGNTENSVAAPSTLIQKFDSLYEGDPNFKNSLVVLLLEVTITKMTGRNNPPMPDKILNLLTAMRDHSRPCFDLVSANFNLLGDRAMRRHMAKHRPHAFLDWENVDKVIKPVLEDIIARVPKGEQAVISLSMDGTKVPKNKSYNHGLRCIVGGAFPQHLVPCPEDNDMLKRNLMNESKDKDGIDSAEEVKVCVVSLQNAKLGFSPWKILCGRPQSINEDNNFNEEITKIVEDFCNTNRSSVRLASTANDGVSVDAKFVWRRLLMFLDGSSNSISMTDPNHNAKNMRYQLFGGNSVVFVGKTAIDPGLLLTAAIPKELWRITDFASDLLVLRLASSTTVSKIRDLLVREDNKEVTCLSLTLFFLHLGLVGVNSKTLDFETRIISIWSSMIWFTSLKGVSMISKRNYVCAAIATVFLSMMSDIPNLRLCTSEPNEHAFGCLRQYVREFTVNDMIALIQKFDRKLEAVYKSGLKSSRDPKKGYASTLQDFLSGTQPDQAKLVMNDGRVDPSAASALQPLAELIWSQGRLRTLLNTINDSMKHLLLLFGTIDQDISPFCIKFGSNLKSDLVDTLKSYLPNSFQYAGLNGETTCDLDELVEEEDSNETVEDSEDDESKQQYHERLVHDLLAMLRADQEKESSNESDGSCSDGDEEKTSQPEEDNDDDEGGSGECTFSLPQKGTDVRSLIAVILNAGKESSASSAQWHRIVSQIVDCMSLLEMKQRETGSNEHAMKHQNINGRWMMKSIGISPSVSEEMTIRRDIAVRVRTNKTGTAALPYRVHCIYNKYYNKWYMDSEPLIWKPKTIEEGEGVNTSNKGTNKKTTGEGDHENKTSKGKGKKKQSRILGRLLKMEGLSGLWCTAEVNDSSERDVVWRIFQEDDIIDILGNL